MITGLPKSSSYFKFPWVKKQQKQNTNKPKTILSHQFNYRLVDCLYTMCPSTCPSKWDAYALLSYLFTRL